MTQILQPTERDIKLVAEKLRRGEVVAVPTETVYGLAGDATNAHAVERIFFIKKRPPKNPLISHYLDAKAVQQDGVMNGAAQKLAQAFWPGPLTLVLPKSRECRIAKIVSDGLSTIAVRVPAHPVMRKVLAEAGRPLAAPSANPSGRLSPVSAMHVKQDLEGKIAFVLDGGQCEVGLESTIVDVSGKEPVILRAGTITVEDIEAKTGLKLAVYQGDSKGAPKAPGMAFRHYAPRCPLRLTTDNPIEGEGLLTFDNAPVPKGFATMLNLSPSGDLEEAAANLFRYLHQLEEQGVSRIAVAEIPNVGIGIAINERLRKAAESAV